jgi:fluoride ion exporter CrcB/FEX
MTGYFYSVVKIRANEFSWPFFYGDGLIGALMKFSTLFLGVVKIGAISRFLCIEKAIRGESVLYISLVRFGSLRHALPSNKFFLGGKNE